MVTTNDPYILPTKAAVLLKNADIRERELLRVIDKYDIGKHGLHRDREDVLLNDVCANVKDSMFGQALRYLTLCTSGRANRYFTSYSIKHRAENLTINGTKHYVANGVMIAAVLMCGGRITQAGDGPNAFLSIIEPRQCGERGSRTGCGRLITSSRKRLCSVCRAKAYKDRPRRRNVYHMFYDMSANSLTEFPPTSDLLGPAFNLP